MKKNKNKMTNRIDELIKQRGFTIKKVAGLVNFSQDTINRLKRCAPSPHLNVEHMERLAKALEVFPSELLCLEWQKPGDINTDVLTKALTLCLDAQEKTLHKIDVIALAKITCILYSRISKNPSYGDDLLKDITEDAIKMAKE